MFLKYQIQYRQIQLNIYIFFYVTIISFHFRYLCKEVLREDYSDLTKADVFALGLTIFEACGGGPLPKNGPNWHSIRDGKIRKLSRYSEYLNELITAMTSLDPTERPSAAEIVKEKFLYREMRIVDHRTQL